MHNGLLHDGVDYWARRMPDKHAVVLDDEPPLSYGELARRSDRAAALLQANGVIPGDRVGLAASNSIVWVVAAVAILKAGAIIAPFNDRLLGDELAYLASYSDPRIIVADSVRAALLTGSGVKVPILELDDLDAVGLEVPKGWEAVRVPSSSVAMIIFTSGSTARPKGAMMSHGNYLAKYMEMHLLDQRLGGDTRSLMPFGLHSSPGTPWGILFTTTIGGTLFCTRKYDAERTLRTLVEQRITFFIGVPMIYDQIAQLPEFRNADLSALTFARVGGASGTHDTPALWRDKGVSLRQLYGMTEVGGGSIIASEEEAAARPLSCGRGLAFSRFRIVGDDGIACEPGQPGHVLLRGPGMMTGYWRDSEATSDAVRDGWMHTGDIGVVDEEGYFTFVDRAKEMIKSGGFNISPSEIEAVLLEIEGVEEAAVFSVSDPKFSEVPCACIYAPAALDPQAIFEHCRRRLAGFKLPRYILPRPTPLPRLASEKIDRRLLKADIGDPSRLGPKLGTSAK